MIGKSNKIAPDHDANGWDFGDNTIQDERMLFEEELLEYHHNQTKCDGPLTAVFVILCCPIFILVLMTWGPFARNNKNCYGHEYFANVD